jgi:hypothetical protein
MLRQRGAVDMVGCGITLPRTRPTAGVPQFLSRTTEVRLDLPPPPGSFVVSGGNKEGNR